MAKKKTDSRIPTELRESASKIWLAGLGALSAAEEEGGKLFKNLVERGEKFESRGKKQMKKVQGKIEHRVGDAREKAEASWTRFENTVDDKIAGTLKRLGVPSRDEIKTLTRRVEELTKKVDRLKPAPKPRKKTAAKTA